MEETQLDILRFVKENDVKFIRMSFCDMFGVQKNIAIMADELPRAFEYGISFDASAIRGFGNVECSDLFLVPDCSSVAILPWRPSHERVMQMFCTVKNPDGTDFEEDSRYILRQAVKRSAKMGYMCRVGTECEFYLTYTDDDGDPLLKPLDRGSYADIAPLDKGEDIRRSICLALESIGIFPESSHHERGAGQNEIDFRYSDVLTAADNFMMFKYLVKSVAAQSGLFASFMPKPFLDDSGNGMHINLSLVRCGKNVFKIGKEHSETAESFIAGILEHISEITAFLNPLTNSYRRLGAFEAPKYITWSHQNRSQLIRIPASRGDFNRMELRSPDPTCNPYIVFALLLHAGLDGIEKNISLMAPCNRNLYESADYIKEQGIASLPDTLYKALETASDSELVHRVLPENLLRKYLVKKYSEVQRVRQAEDEHAFELKTYFPVL